jgi:hypothetical protein
MSEDWTLKVEEMEGGRLFHLHNDCKLLVKWESEKRLQVELWRSDAMIPPDVGSLYMSSFRKKLVRDAAPVLFAHEVEEDRPQLKETLLADLGLVARALNAPTKSGQTLHALLGASASAESKTVTERLVRYARKGAKFFHTPERVAYAAVKVKKHTEHYRIGSKDFSDWVEQEYWSREVKRLADQQAARGAMQIVTPDDDPLPDVVRERDLSDALRLLRGVAVFRSPEHEVYRRVAPYKGAVYLDLCDEDWRVVEVDRDGWRVISGDQAPVKFTRTAGMLPLREPNAGGSLEDLRDLLHLGDGDDEKRNWRLICGWLVQALSPDGAYGILTLTGAQGSAKSDTQYVLRSLVDPNVAMIRYKPKEERDLFIAASNGWTISLDNMSKVPEWLSNALCNIATLGSFGIRRNYSDDEEVLFKARRPIILNGIGDILTYPDLLDRAAIVRLPPLEGTNKRLTDEEVFARAEEIAPGVFGALLDCLSHYLKVKNDIENPDVRMVSYAKVGFAVEQALDWGEGAFMGSYQESRNEANAVVLESYPVAAVIIEFVEDYPEDDKWESTGQELLDALAARAGDSLRMADKWPRRANELGQQLSDLKTDLARVGVRFRRKTVRGTQLIELWKV